MKAPIGYIGVLRSRSSQIKVLRYDPIRVALVQSTDRQKLIESIAAHLRRVMNDGASLLDAYRTL